MSNNSFDDIRVGNMEAVGFDKKRASQILKKSGVDLVIASTPISVFYTTGLPTLHVAKNPILWVLANQFPFFSLIRPDGEVDLFYWLVFASLDKYSWISQDRAHGILSKQQALSLVFDQIEQWELTKKVIALESQMPRYQSEYLRQKLPQATFVEADQLLLELRLIKSEKEIQRIKKSTEIAEQAILACVDALYDGITDVDLLRIARRTIIDAGAEGWDHLTMGIGASDPEAPGIGTPMHKGDLGRFDFGAVWKGYVSDVSRHVALGSVPEGVEEVMNNTIQVQEFLENQIKPGTDPKTVFKAAQSFTKTLAVQGRVYPTCHSIGLETEEEHLFSAMRSVDFPFSKNMVCDIEVWQHFRNHGLVGIEDCYQITASGCKRLSSLKKRILIKH